jgi:hypothetical protein
MLGRPLAREYVSEPAKRTAIAEYVNCGLDLGVLWFGHRV